MGMTIDDARNILEEVKEFDDSIYQYNKKYLESLNVALNTMRKYQKITEIVKSWRENGLDYDSCDAMENIERVIEDGND